MSTVVSLEDSHHIILTLERLVISRTWSDFHPAVIIWKSCVFYCHYNPAGPYHADALCASSVPVAALDHLRGGETILPLPHPASFSDVEITLRNLVETTQDVDRVQHLWKKQNRKSENGCSWPVSPDMKNGLHSSPSVRPSPKAIDYARCRKPWTQSEGDRN